MSLRLPLRPVLGLALAALASPLAAQAGAPPVETQHRISVLVVQPIGDRGVPNADISILDESVLDAEWGPLRLTPTFQDWAELYQRRGAHYRSNEFGLAIVPRPTKTCYITAGAPGLWCFFSMDATDSGPFILRMKPDEVLSVRIVDESGAPVAGVKVGATVALVKKIEKPEDEDKVLWLTLGESGIDGMAPLPHLQQWRQFQWWRDEPTKELDGARHITFAIPLKSPVKVEVDVWNPPSGFVTLVLPPTARVVVPIPVGVRAYARLRTALPIDPKSAVGRAWPRRVPYRVESADGRAVFTHVGLGTTLDYEVWWDGLMTPKQATVSGPTRAGEELVLPALHPANVGVKKNQK